jgi:hypothetical protein
VWLGALQAHEPLGCGGGEDGYEADGHEDDHNGDELADDGRRSPGSCRRSRPS